MASVQSIPGGPARPPRWEERAAQWLFLGLSPRLPRLDNTVLSPGLPCELCEIERSGAPPLPATWYPAEGPARGAVLLAHPWVPRGQAYFHRGGRIEALRAAGYHSLTFDFGGVGASSRAPGFFDGDLEAALRALAARAPGLSRHLWGVSSGGYWSHPVLSRSDAVRGAFFEDVAANLLVWARRMAPRGLPGYLVFQTLYRRTFRYIDLRAHAPHLRLAAAAYAGGELDRGARPEETRELARLAGGEVLIVPGADHLQAIKLAGTAVIELALATFAKAENASI